MLDIKENSVKQKLYRARKVIRAQVGGKQDG